MHGVTLVGARALASSATGTGAAPWPGLRPGPAGREGRCATNPYTSSVTDDALVAACRAGDPGGLAGVVARFSDRVYRSLALIVKDPEDARDLTQETFVRFHTGLAGFRGETSLHGWLLRIGTNLALNRLRDRARAGASMRWLSTDALPEEIIGPTPPESNPEEVVIRRMEAGEARAFLDRLSPPLRAVAVLRFYEDLAYEEIARVLSIQIGTVRSRLNAVRWQARAAFARR